MAFSGRLDFDPENDELTGANGEKFKLSSPYGDELPEQGFDPGTLSVFDGLFFLLVTHHVSLTLSVSISIYSYFFSVVSGVEEFLEADFDQTALVDRSYTFGSTSRDSESPGRI